MRALVRPHGETPGHQAKIAGPKTDHRISALKEETTPLPRQLARGRRCRAAHLNDDSLITITLAFTLS
jgi:hypothetical protein